MAEPGSSGGLPDLKGRVSIDYKDLEKFLGKVEETTKKTDSKMRELGDSFDRVGQRMTLFATVPIVAAMGFATKAASDLSESMNVTKITFHDAAPEIDRFVKEASKIGFSERAAREATAAFGGLLQNLGYTSKESAVLSEQMVRLGADLGSAFNKDPAQAADALQAALRGETEPARAFNIMLDDMTVKTKAVEMGLADSTAEVTKHQKTQATLAIIMEQTKNVQGDFANTSEGLANQQRALRAELENTAASIGTKLLPVALNLAHGVSGLIDAFASLSDSQQYALLGIAAFIAALGPGLSIIGKVIGSVDDLVKVFRRLQAAQLAAPIGILGGAFALLGLSILGASSDYDTFKTKVESKIKPGSLDSLAEAYNATRAETEKLIGKTDDLHDLWNVGAAVAANRAADDLGRLKEQYDDLNTTLDRVSAATELSHDQAEQLAEVMGIDMSKGVDAATEAMISNYLALSSNNTATNNIQEATDELGKSVEGTTEHYDAFTKLLDSTLGAQITSTQATLDLKDKTDALGAAYEAAGGRADIRTQKGAALIGAMNDEVAQIYKTVDALIANGEIENTDIGRKQAIASQIEQLKQKYPELASKFQVYLDKLPEAEKPREAKISADTSSASASLDALAKDLASMTDPNRWYIRINPVTGQQTFQAKFAGGGQVQPSRWFQVGEQGPELLRLDSSGLGTVVPSNGATPLGGDTYVDNHFSISGVSDAQDVVNRVMREFKLSLQVGAGAR